VRQRERVRDDRDLDFQRDIKTERTAVERSVEKTKQKKQKSRQNVQHHKNGLQL